MLIHGVADDKEFVRDEVERRRGTHAYAPRGSSFGQTIRCCRTWVLSKVTVEKRRPVLHRFGRRVPSTFGRFGVD
jgi:hypothetical protein